MLHQKKSIAMLHFIGPYYLYSQPEEYNLRACSAFTH
jgi:hypothetical protein